MSKSGTSNVIIIVLCKYTVTLNLFTLFSKKYSDKLRGIVCPSAAFSIISDAIQAHATFRRNTFISIQMRPLNGMSTVGRV